MKVTEQEKKYVIALGILAVFAALYLCVYKPLVNQAETLKAEVETMQGRVDVYAATMQSKEFYEEETAVLIEAIEAVDAQLPQGLPQESIISVMDTLSKELKLALPAIEISEVEETDISALTTGEEAVVESTPATLETDTDTFRALKTTVTTATVCDYETFKKLLRYVEAYPTQIALDDIALQVDETGLMAGFTIHFYGLHVPGRTEVYAPLGAYKEGKENIFKHQTIGTTAAPSVAQMVYDDLFLTVDPVQADSAAITMGSANDRERKTYVYEETNAPSKVALHLTQEGGNYYATYQVGEQQYPADGTKLALTPSDGIGVKVYCANRIDANDLNSVLVEVINETDKIAYLYIRNDDAENPRFALAQSKGNVRVVEK